MKKDTEVRLYMQERKKGMSQRVAAARSGLGERTARKYEQALNELPHSVYSNAARKKQNALSRPTTRGH